MNKHPRRKKSCCEKTEPAVEEPNKIESKSTDIISDIPKSARSSFGSNNILNGFKFKERSRIAKLDKSRSVAEDSLLIKTPAT